MDITNIWILCSKNTLIDLFLLINPEKNNWYYVEWDGNKKYLDKCVTAVSLGNYCFKIWERERAIRLLQRVVHYNDYVYIHCLTTRKIRLLMNIWWKCFTAGYFDPIFCSPPPLPEDSVGTFQTYLSPFLVAS